MPFIQQHTLSGCSSEHHLHLQPGQHGTTQRREHQVGRAVEGGNLGEWMCVSVCLFTFIAVMERTKEGWKEGKKGGRTKGRKEGRMDGNGR